MTNRKQAGYEQERPQWGILFCPLCWDDAARCELPEEHREDYETYADKVASEQTTVWDELEKP